MSEPTESGPYKIEIIGRSTGDELVTWTASHTDFRIGDSLLDEIGDELIDAVVVKRVWDGPNVLQLWVDLAVDRTSDAG